MIFVPRLPAALNALSGGGKHVGCKN